MFKSLIVVSVLTLVMVSSASATVLAWVGEGFREVGSANSGLVTYINYRTPRMATEQDCKDFIAIANTLSAGKNVKGYDLLSKVHAKCIDATMAD